MARAPQLLRRALLVSPLVAAALAAPRPVIINADPGVDDAIAILLALASPEIDVRAVTVNFGNSANATQLTLNALHILDVAGRNDVPVYVGASEPLSSAWHDLGGAHFHGQNGLGDVPVPPARRPWNTTLTAAEAIVEACRGWEVKPALVSLSPLTNVALALDLEPRLPELCPELYVMGGTVAAPGNVSPLGEANWANDAEAAQRVYAAGFALRAAPLDVTMATWMDDAFLETLRALPSPAGPFIWNITRVYVEGVRTYSGFPNGMPTHDPSAVMLLLHPELYEQHRWASTIDTSVYPAPTRGMVVADRRGGPLTPPPPGTAPQFAMKANVSAVLEALRTRLGSLQAAGTPARLVV